MPANPEGFPSCSTFTGWMTLAFVWQGEPGGAGADGAPGKDGPRVSIHISEK